MIVVSEEKTKELFVKQLKHYMDITGTKASDLANRMGVTPCSVSRWMHCHHLPPVNRIKEMADVLGCKPSDLLGTEQNDVLTVSNLSADEYQLLWDYRNGDDITRATIKRLLDFTKVMKIANNEGSDTDA